VNPKRSAVYPGTFDPITNGHQDLVRRAAGIFDRVVIGIAANPGKAPLFSLAERVELAQKVLGELRNVTVLGYAGLTVDFAREQGAREAWLVDAKGRITEGGSSSAWIVSPDGKLITHPLGEDILPGITRAVVIDMIKAQGLPFEERTFTVEEAYQAREAFITSASQVVLPVVRIDGRPVGNGAPGLITTALRRDYHRYAEIAV